MSLSFSFIVIVFMRNDRLLFRVVNCAEFWSNQIEYRHRILNAILSKAHLCTIELFHSIVCGIRIFMRKYSSVDRRMQSNKRLQLQRAFASLLPDASSFRCVHFPQFAEQKRNEREGNETTDEIYSLGRPRQWLSLSHHDLDPEQKRTQVHIMVYE